MDNQKYYDVGKLKEARFLLFKEWVDLYNLVSLINRLSNKIGNSGSVSTLPSDIVALFDALDALPSALSSLNAEYRARTKANLLHRIDRFNLKGTQLVLARCLYIDMEKIIREV